MNEEWSQPEPSRGPDLWEFWQDIIDQTIKFVEEQYHPKWERFLRLFAGDHWGMIPKEVRGKDAEHPADQIVINRLGPYIRKLGALVVSQQSYINVKPENGEAETSAILQETAVNYEWRRRKYHRVLRKIFRDAAIIGHGVSCQTWNLEIDESATPHEDGLLEYREYVKKDAPMLRRVSPFNFFFDLAASDKDLETARFCFERFYQPPRYVISNNNYDAKTRSMILNREEKPEYMTEEIGGSTFSDLPENAKVLMILYRLLDKKYQKEWIFAKGCERPLLIGEPLKYDYLDGFEYKMYGYIDVPNDWYPMGMCEWAEDAQLELDRTRTALFHYRRRNLGGQYTGDLDDAGQQAFIRGDKYVPKQAGTEGVKPIENARISEETFAAEAIINDDLERTTEMSEITQGVATRGRRSATETKNRTQFFMVGIDDTTTLFDEFVESNAIDLIKHIKAHYDIPRILPITGPLGYYWGKVAPDAKPTADGTYWVQFTKEDIIGEFDVTVESTAKPKTNPEVEAAGRYQYGQFVLALYNFWLQLAQLGMDPNQGFANLTELARWVAEPLGYAKSLSRIIPATAILPPPILTQTAMAQGQQGAGVPQFQMNALSAPATGATDQGNMMQQAADPMSMILGAIGGGKQQ